MNKPPKQQPAPKVMPKSGPPKPAPAKKPTAPAVKMPMPTSVDSERSIHVRKIENGHIIRESGMDGKGNYMSKETYSPTPPTIQMSPAPTKQPMQPKMPMKGKVSK
jgi:hypothetical protein